MQYSKILKLYLEIKMTSLFRTSKKLEFLCHSQNYNSNFSLMHSLPILSFLVLVWQWNSLRHRSQTLCVSPYLYLLIHSVVLTVVIRIQEHTHFHDHIRQWKWIWKNEFFVIQTSHASVSTTMWWQSWNSDDNGRRLVFSSHLFFAVFAQRCFILMSQSILDVLNKSNEWSLWANDLINKIPYKKIDLFVSFFFLNFRTQ